ncbi:restriction endonuclease subunit S [Pseudoalteromonas sp. UBA2102]|uniref:restriction endonuclease subunit S n=1 Tax=Pseudoalteromonas sp. UBA2102 TaxID=1947291 RepID=UPI00257D5C1C|nr:restriction endonuclease subunit S [Pseudoalteromonas sp. UBA2102]|tara:strand:- start:4453 stop:5670 length:1218 start_codon:yes stop_codon:yes gene_type:complete
MGWSISKMSEVTNIISGGTPKSGISDYWFGDVKWITPKDMGKITGIYVSETGRNITQLGLDKSSAKLIPENSVILSTRAPIGYLAINTVPMATNQGCRGLVPKNTLDTKFLYYFLLKSVSLLNDLGSGTTFKELSKTALEKVEIPHPEITEQKHIVAILEQAFADIEQARAKTEQNLKNARELFESYLQQVFSQHGDDWGVKKIAEIAETCLGKMLDKKKNKGNPKPYLRNQNVQWFNINTDDLLEMRFEDSEYERYAIKKGDLVICEGGYPGRGAIWEQDEDIFFQKALHRIRCHNPLYNRWVLYYLYLSDCNGTLKNSFTGAGIQHFTGKSLKQLALPIPPVELTEKFVRNFDELFNHVISLEHVYHNKLKSIDQLKKSILQKAFSGELTKALEVDTNKGAVA